MSCEVLRRRAESFMRHASEDLDRGGYDLVLFHVEQAIQLYVKYLLYKRLSFVIEENKWLTRRLALENDEKHYTVADVIEFAESYSIPVVFDHYHYMLNPSRFDVDRLIDTWPGITPEMHFSSKPDGETRFGEHGGYVDPQNFMTFLSMFECKVEADVVVEAKKEVAMKSPSRPASLLDRAK